MSSKVSKKKKSLRAEIAERKQKLAGSAAVTPQPRNIMEVLTKWRLVTYAWIVFFPPYGLYRIWSKESTFWRSEKVMWTLMIIVYMLQFLRLILFS